MKSTNLTFHGNGRVGYVEHNLGSLNQNEVVIESCFSAISAGSELLAFRGELPQRTGLDPALSNMNHKAKFPLQYGYSTVGSITHASPGLPRSLIGKNVFGFLTHGTRHRVPMDQLLLIPEGIPLEYATLIPTLETATGLVMDAAPLVGESVAILGQGMVGQMVTLLIKDMHLNQLYLIDPIRSRREAVTGLDLPFMHASPCHPDDSMFLQSSCDLIFELTGNPQAIDRAIPRLKHEGRLILGSWYGDKSAQVFLGEHFHQKRLRIISSQVSHVKGELSSRISKKDRLNFVLKLLQKLPLKMFQSKIIPFHHAQEAYEDLSSKKPTITRYIFSYDQSKEATFVPHRNLYQHHGQPLSIRS